MSRQQGHTDTFTLTSTSLHLHFSIRILSFAFFHSPIHRPILHLQTGSIEYRDWWSVCTKPHFLSYKVTKLVPYRETFIPVSSIYFNCVTYLYAKIYLFTNKKMLQPPKKENSHYITPRTEGSVLPSWQRCSCALPKEKNYKAPGMYFRCITWQPFSHFALFVKQGTT